jgi:hypothetical protein
LWHDRGEERDRGEESDHQPFRQQWRIFQSLTSLFIPGVIYSWYWTTMDPDLDTEDELSLLSLCDLKTDNYKLAWSQEWAAGQSGWSGFSNGDKDNDSNNDGADPEVLSMRSITSMHMQALKNHHTSIFQWKNLNIHSPEWYARHFNLSSKLALFSAEQRVLDWSQVDSFQEGIELRYGSSNDYNPDLYRVGPPAAWQCLSIHLAERVMNAQLEALAAQKLYLKCHRHERLCQKFSYFGTTLRPRMDYTTSVENYLSCLDQRKNIMKENRRLIRANKNRIIQNREYDTTVFNVTIWEWLQEAVTATFCGVGADDLFLQEDAIMAAIVEDHEQEIAKVDALYVNAMVAAWLQDANPQTLLLGSDVDSLIQSLRDQNIIDQACVGHRPPLPWDRPYCGVPAWVYIPPAGCHQKKRQLSCLVKQHPKKARVGDKKKLVRKVPAHIGGGEWKYTQLDDDDSTVSSPQYRDQTQLDAYAEEEYAEEEKQKPRQFRVSFLY